MLAFDIEIDGQRWLVAGQVNWEHLLLQLSAFRHDGAEEFRLDVISVFDLDENGVNNARWVASPKLSVGSKVTVTLIETDCADTPHRSYRYDADVQESPFTAEEEDRIDREEWLRLEAKFGSSEAD